VALQQRELGLQRRARRLQRPVHAAQPIARAAGPAVDAAGVWFGDGRERFSAGVGCRVRQELAAAPTVLQDGQGREGLGGTGGRGVVHLGGDGVGEVVDLDDGKLDGEVSVGTCDESAQQRLGGVMR
jgi:hypothetical protein